MKATLKRFIPQLSTISRFFILTAGALLLGAGLTRFLILIGNVPQLHRPDPLLGISLQVGVLVAGAAELVVALVCLFGSRTGLQAMLVGWLALNYVVFRIGLYSSGIHPEWTCLGLLTDPLHLARGTTGFGLSYVVPSYLLLGSFAALLWPWLRRLFPPASAFEKMPCPACGRHIRFAVQNLGQTVPCPQCKTTVTLRRPGTLKTECYFCKGHVEFPAHALGQKIQCPHCKMEITLMDIALKQPA